MRLLLDTHTLLWWLTDADRLSRRALEAIEDPANEAHVSIISLWEATIKIASAKLTVPGQTVKFLIQNAEQSGVVTLPVLSYHLL